MAVPILPLDNVSVHEGIQTLDNVPMALHGHFGDEMQDSTHSKLSEEVPSSSVEIRDQADTPPSDDVPENRNMPIRNDAVVNVRDENPAEVTPDKAASSPAKQDKPIAIASEKGSPTTTDDDSSHFQPTEDISDSETLVDNEDDEMYKSDVPDEDLGDEFEADFIDDGDGECWPSKDSEYDSDHDMDSDFSDSESEDDDPNSSSDSDESDVQYSYSEDDSDEGSDLTTSDVDSSDEDDFDDENDTEEFDDENDTEGVDDENDTDEFDDFDHDDGDNFNDNDGNYGGSNKNGSSEVDDSEHGNKDTPGDKVDADGSEDEDEIDQAAVTSQGPTSHSHDGTEHHVENPIGPSLHIEEMDIVTADDVDEDITDIEGLSEHTSLLPKY